MKRIVLITALALIVALAAIGGTYALITREDTAVNIITMGDLKIAALQSAIPEGGGDPVPFDGKLSFVPTRSFSWIFAVKNLGGQEAYIRVSLEKVVELAEGIEGTPDADLMRLDLNTTDWEYRDGYYYYLTALGAGKTTAPLFTAVTFDEKADNMYQGATATANIDVSAVQVKNNGDTVFDAVGWLTADEPETKTE